jgi:pSer/pThr/pTyr-binding forkhead associated (FHA) protein
MATLHVKSGPLAGKTIEVESDLTIGRQNADVTIDDAQISRRHAVLRPHADGLEVEDLGSSNGTFVDGRRIEAPTLVGDGAQVKLGVTVLEVEQTRLPEATQVAVQAGREETKAWNIAATGTTVRPMPAPAAQARHAVAQPAEPAAPSGAPIGDGPVGAFRPPTRRRRARLASRSWVPVVLSFGTVLLTAVALVIYFAAR